MRDLKDVSVDKDDNILNILDGNDKIINIISLRVIRLHCKNNENHYNNDDICNYDKNNIGNNNLNNSSNNIANNLRYLFEK